MHNCENYYRSEDNEDDAIKLCLSDGKQTATVVPQGSGAGDWVPFEVDSSLDDKTKKDDYFAANKVRHE